MSDNRMIELLPCPCCGDDILLPCPFCWGEAALFGDGKYGYSVKCRNPMCLAKIDGWDTAMEAIEAWNKRAEHHAYEQRITGDGSDWGEIMIDAFNNLIANACESCTSKQMARLTDYIRGELWHGSAIR